MLSPQRLVLFGFNPTGLARIEEQRIADYRLQAWPAESVAGQPAQAAAEAWAALASRAGPILLHFDVDAIDSTDLPLANYPHFNLGQTFASAMTCLASFCGNPQFAGLVLTEVNPDHDADGSQLNRLINGVANALSAADASAGRMP